MKASVTNGPGQGFVLEDIDIDNPIGAEVLVQLKASGLCRSDLSVQENELGGLYPLPGLLGHEPAGEVIAVGPAVTDFEVGDHVVGSLIQSCGSCPNCLTGRANICSNPDATLRREGEAPRLSRGGEALTQTFGLGAFAQQILAHQNQLVKIPKDIPWASAALLGCGVITGAGSVLNKAQVQQGESVVIIGGGGVGLNGVTGAVLAGANPIIVVDVDDAKLELAKDFGATHTVNSRTSEDATAEVVEMTNGGAHHVFDFVGHSTVLQSSLGMVGRGGAYYIVGLNPEGTFTASGLETAAMERTITGVIMGSSTIKRDIPVYAELYRDNRFKLDELVSAEIALSQIGEGFDMLKDGNNIRVVITDFDN
jgi:S-(hydroxymethyl)glutathione dehydrogenase/alcohol dehydrogenase